MKPLIQFFLDFFGWEGGTGHIFQKETFLISCQAYMYAASILVPNRGNGAGEEELGVSAFEDH